MAQGKDFCLKRSSRTERIADGEEHRKQDRLHHEEAYRHPTLSAIESKRVSFW
jgi:hypothetical protein